MRYGCCTGFASNPPFGIDPSLEEVVGGAGFDFIEYPLMSVYALSEEGYKDLRARRDRYNLACDCGCNLFPGSVPVVGEAYDEKKMRDYLEAAFKRAAELGTKKLIFGSAGARRKGDLLDSIADAYFQNCLEILEEYCAKYDIIVCIEPIRRGEADFINTLDEGARHARIARDKGLEHIYLLADLFHMMCNGEDVSCIEKHIDIIRHVHVAEADRALPGSDFSAYISSGLALLNKLGYQGTVSFEAKRPETIAQMVECRELLKKNL